MLVTAVSPGPAVFAIMTTAMAHGRRDGLVLTAGILTGSAAWGLVALFGLVSMLESLGDLLVWVRIAGGAYLLWLAWKAFRAAMAPAQLRSAATDTSSPMRLYLSGLFIHLTNPKAVFGWAATIAVGVPVGSEPGRAFAVFAASIAIIVTVKTSMALGFSSGPAIAAYGRARRWIQGAVGVLFAAAGTRMLTAS